MARYGRSIAALSLCLVTALAGCSDDGDDEESSPTGGGRATEQRTFDLASATYPTMSVAIPTAPVATAPAQYDGFSLDVYALHRESDRSVYVVFGLRNDSEDDKGFQRELEDPAVDAPVEYAISAVSLFDAVNLKRHLVFLDEQGGCLCSLTATVTVEAGSTLYLAAQFPAPPPDIESMTLQTPIGSVANIPLTGA